MDVNSKQEQSRQPEINYTELLKREYGQDRGAQRLISEFRTNLGKTDREIYETLESFY